MVGIILVNGVMHSFTLKHSSRFQNLFTLVKIIVIVILIIIAFILPAEKPNALNFRPSWHEEISRSGFAVSMIYVSFAYTGWNASPYISAGINTPKRNLPRSLIISTLFVAAVYILFQYVLLRNATVTQLQGKEEVIHFIQEFAWHNQRKVGKCIYHDTINHHHEFLSLGGSARYGGAYRRVSLMEAAGKAKQARRSGACRLGSCHSQGRTRRIC